MPRSNPRPSVGSSYDRLSRMYDAVFAPIEAPLTDAAIEMLEAQPGEQVLEIGPGTGRALADIGLRVGPRGAVLGIDLSSKMLAASARRLASTAGLSGARLAGGDARALPLGRSACDAVFMSFTLELFEPSDATRVLAECARVLRRPGRLVVASLWRDSRPNLMTSAYELGHRMFPHVLDCRPIDLEGALRQAGFEVQRSATHSLSGIPVRIAVATPPER